LIQSLLNDPENDGCLRRSPCGVGIAAGKKGARLSDIGHAIEKYVNAQGAYGILQEYGGHGIGTEMHQEPHVLNFGKAGNGPEIIAGMALAIEPMITRGAKHTKC
jgi:methionyl aminopeptidase